MSDITSTNGKYVMRFDGSAAAGFFGPAASDLKQVYHYDNWVDFGLIYTVDSSNSVSLTPTTNRVTVIAWNVNYTQDPADSGDNNLYITGSQGSVVFGGQHQGVFTRNRWYVRPDAKTQSTSSAGTQAQLPKYYQGYRVDPDPTLTTSIAWSVSCIIGNTSTITTFNGIKQTIKNNWDRVKNQIPPFVSRGTGEGGLGYIPADTSVSNIVSSAGVTVTTTTSVSFILNITAYGGAGGDALGATGGQGGTTTWYGTFQTSNLSLTLYVAGRGTDSNKDYFGGAAGGGATAVLAGPTILTIAAGGGGASDFGAAAGSASNGGAGGPATGQDAADVSYDYGGKTGVYGSAGGKGGTQTAPGAAGSNGYPGSGRNGGDGNMAGLTSWFAGGWGIGTGGRGPYNSNNDYNYGSGGGGAGYYGGGGGGYQDSVAQGQTGGGGGSNYIMSSSITGIILSTSSSIRGGNTTSGGVILQVATFVSSYTLVTNNGALVTSFVTRTTSVSTTTYGYTSAAARTVTFSA